MVISSDIGVLRDIFSLPGSYVCYVLRVCAFNLAGVIDCSVVEANARLVGFFNGHTLNVAIE
jgi:Na+/citrate or Na+/malate symporter